MTPTSDITIMITELFHFSQTLERSNHLIADFYAVVNWNSDEILDTL